MSDESRRGGVALWAAHPAFRLLPLLAVAGVFLPIGGAATLVSRRPLVGALFVVLLAAVVVVTLHAFP